MAALESLEILRLKLHDANRNTNLTRITSSSEYWCKHIADSLSIGLIFPGIMTGSFRFADVGSGAGFPLLPLVWANPRLEGVGIESKQRKAAFIESIAAELDLPNCSVIARQVREVCDMPAYRGRFDIVLARAVGTAEHLLKESGRLLRRGRRTRLVFYKTPGQLKRERQAIESAAAERGLRVNCPPAFELPLNAGQRQFIILKPK